MKRYKVEKYNNDIKTVEVWRETEKAVFFANARGGVDQERKGADWHQWFNTWHQAKNFLIGRTENQISYLESKLCATRADLTEILQMMPPNEENGTSK
jgi:hypothetical protein